MTRFDTPAAFSAFWPPTLRLHSGGQDATAAATFLAAAHANVGAKPRLISGPTAALETSAAADATGVTRSDVSSPGYL